LRYFEVGQINEKNNVLMMNCLQSTLKNFMQCRRASEATYSKLSQSLKDTLIERLGREKSIRLAFKKTKLQVAQKVLENNEKEATI
jgi:hypothetical protein